MISKEKLTTLKKIGEDNMISKEELESERLRITLLKSAICDDIDGALLAQCTRSLEWIDTALELYRQLEESEKKLPSGIIE